MAKTKATTSGVAKTKRTTRRKKPKLRVSEVSFHPDNRILTALGEKRLRGRYAVKDTLVSSQYKKAELAPAFRAVYQSDPAEAMRLSEAYAVTLKDSGEHREFFQGVAQMQKKERIAAIRGYRNAGQSRGVVHAVSQLPRLQARTIMHDFVIDENGEKDENSVHEVLLWLKDAGAQMRDLERTGPRHADGEMDEAVVEFFEDVADAISDAVTAVVDAIVDAVESIAEAIADVVSWIAEEVADLVRALIEAGRTIFELLEAAIVTGYELVKKIVQGLQAIGKALFEVLEAAFNLAKDALITVLKAIDQIGRTLGELLSWLAQKTFDIIKKGIEALIEIGKSIGNILEQALVFGFTLIRNTVRALIEIGETVVSILVTAVTRPGALFDEIVRAFNDLGNTLGDLFDEVIDAGADLVREIARSAARIGTAIVDFMEYAATAAVDIVTKIVHGLMDIGKTIADMVITIAQHGFAAVKKIVNAAFDLGKTLISLLKDVFELGMNLLKDVIKAAFQLGKTVLEFTKSMVEFTYKAAARLIEAALEVGAAVADILEAVAGASYYVFRKIVNGVLQALGPVGDIFEWLIDKGEALASELWRQAVLAARFVKNGVVEILDWAADQTVEVFDRILELVEDVGTAIYDVIEWAEAAGEWALVLLGEATERIGNSIAYLLNYIEKDFLPGLAKVVEGILNAGHAIANLVSWMAKRAVEVVTEVVRGALEAGVTIATLITETIKHPTQALENLMQALRDLEQTLADIYQAVIIETGEQFIDEVTRALVEIGEAAVDILLGVLEVAGGAIGTVVAILFELLGSYRPLTANERADAEIVFGDSIDLDEVFIAQESVSNDIIFGVQDFFNALFAGDFAHLTDERDSRAFVTGNLINFDTDEPFERHTLIHELTHVWQNQHIGPVYLADAIVGQIMDGYNYGYQQDRVNLGTGDGAQTVFAGNVGDGPLTPGIYRVLRANAVVANDNGVGGFTGGGVSGTIDYNTGDVSITFSAAPAAGQLIEMDSEAEVVIDYVGTTDDVNGGYLLGEGAGGVLNAAGGDFDEFNPEQQGQITMQYFARRVLMGQSGAQLAPWQQYIDVVQDGMPDRVAA